MMKRFWMNDRVDKTFFGRMTELMKLFRHNIT